MWALAVMEQLIGAWMDVVAWAAILAVLAACAGIVIRRDRRRVAAPQAAAVEIPVAQGRCRLTPQREWELVVRYAAGGLERQAALVALQHGTALKIAAAEHAYFRLVADCARICPTCATPLRQAAGGAGRSRPPERPAPRLAA
jgi:hypothetical protein